MQTMLKYGTTDLRITVPDDADVIVPAQLPGLADEKLAVLEALRRPTGAAPLKQSVKSTDRVCIVISDMTRPTPNHKLVPWLLEELAHVPREQFVIINGTGSHRDNTPEELEAMLGKAVLEQVRVINHNAFDKDRLTSLGKSATGGDVYLNKAYCESDFRIVTGFIEPHFFAGFSGGPKGIMPGIAGIETILHFHSVRMIGHPLSTWGILEENPVQQEATQIVSMCKPHFMLNVALNGEKDITAVFAGDVIEAHREGCRFVLEHTMVACDEPYDVVVTTNGGYPLDQNLYQAVKGMSAAHKIVRRGGAILAVAECSDGLPDHGNYAALLRMADSPEALLALLKQPGFSQFDQWQVQKQMMVQLWADVYAHTSLPDPTIRQAMLRPANPLQRTLDELLHAYGGTAPRIAVLPYGPLTIPYLREQALPADAR